MPEKNHFIANRWLEGAGPRFASTDPATGQVLWQGRAATAAEIDSAVAAARHAFEPWVDLPLSRRIDHLHRFAQQLSRHKSNLAQSISRDTGKPTWEALAEVDSMIAKIDISIDAFHERRAQSTQDLANTAASVRYKPHGVVAVFGPFNMPGHLPNGHIVPALLAGNTVLFKPSEQAPLVGQRTVELWQAAGLPPGVLNLLQGARDTGQALANHPGLDGLFFTGSLAAGRALNRALAEHPGRILALEMGGNNPLIVHDVSDLTAAAYLTIQSAFITAGQRCSCARRLIVPTGNAGDAFLDRLIAITQTIRVGPHTADPEPFMGPVISSAAAEKLLAAQASLLAHGATPMLEMRGPSVGAPPPSTPGAERDATPRIPLDSPAMLTPGLIDVTPIPHRPDEELFGPLLQVIRVPDFHAAIAQANHTAYGLAAGLLSDNPDLWPLFYRQIRAGVVCLNRQTTSASSRLPFGGIGLSGNHRPSGYWAADYCSYPVACMQHSALALPPTLTPGIAL